MILAKTELLHLQSSPIKAECSIHVSARMMCTSEDTSRGCEMQVFYRGVQHLLPQHPVVLLLLLKGPFSIAKSLLRLSTQEMYLCDVKDKHG
mmetsp:Transcript_23594/g.52282  ORF Transcript_23594/g.52282 Transcript_23594/m.52282 type:complete len:92 (+) Transcript_23594:808-1083(+)